MLISNRIGTGTDYTVWLNDYSVWMSAAAAISLCLRNGYLYANKEAGQKARFGENRPCQMAIVLSV